MDVTGQRFSFTSVLTARSHAPSTPWARIGYCRAPLFHRQVVAPNDLPPLTYHDSTLLIYRSILIGPVGDIQAHLTAFSQQLVLNL